MMAELTSIGIWIEDKEEFVQLMLKHAAEKKKNFSQMEFFSEIVRFWGEKHD